MTAQAPHAPHEPHGTRRAADATPKPAPHADGARDLRWPPERLWWSDIDARELGPRPDARRLGYLLEADLPVPLERVHATFARVGPGRWIACCADRAALRDALAAGAVTLSPAALPAFLDGATDPARINLLVGEFEPRAVRAMRLRTSLAAAAAVALCAAALAWGFARRAGAERAGAEAADAMRRDVLAQVLGEGAAARPDAELLLGSELARLRATRGGAATGSASAAAQADATEVLGGLLAAWPRDVRLETETLSVAADSVTLAGTVPTSADAQRVADALAAFAAAGDAGGPPWRLEQPRFESARGAAGLTLRLRRDRGGAP